MSIAPEPILRAGNDTVSWACIYCRNQTLRDGAPTKMINDAMEAIHEVPRMLVDWEHHDLAEVRTHLGCFPSSRWPGAPDLVSYFDQKLREFGYEERRLRSLHRIWLPLLDSARLGFAEFISFPLVFGFRRQIGELGRWTSCPTHL